MPCVSYDLPVVQPIAERHIQERGMSDRVLTGVIDFLHDDLPAADVITSALIAVENIIDDERRKNAFGLLMSLNRLIEFGDAFDFTGADFAGWCREAGFIRCEVLPLASPASAAIAYK